MFQNMEIFESPCFNTWRFKNLHGLNTEIFESPCFIMRRFKNLHVWKHGDWKILTVLPYKTSMFQYMEISESPCIETWRFKNFCVLYMEIFESPCIETRRFKNMNSFALQNLHVSIHGDFWISMYPCIETRRFKILHVLEHGD